MPNLDEEAWFNRYKIRQAEFLAGTFKDDGRNGIAVRIERSFHSNFTLELMRFRDPEFPEGDFNLLRLAFTDQKNDQNNKIGQVYASNRLIETFRTPISDEEFGQIFENLQDSEFYDAAFQSRSLPGTDGIAYFIEARDGKKYNFIFRLTCQDEFGQDFLFGEALFDLALVKFPMVNDRLNDERAAVEHMARSC